MQLDNIFDYTHLHVQTTLAESHGRKPRTITGVGMTMATITTTQ